MLFLQLVYCLLLTYGPAFVVYKSTNLSEFNALFPCLWAGLFYGATQLVKMILLATFLPTSESETFETGLELVKALFGVVDIVGLHFALKKTRAGTTDVKVLAVGLGWAIAESVLQRAAPIWMAARGMEFEWSQVQAGIEANANLLFHIAMSAIVFVYAAGRRQEGGSGREPLLLVVMGAAVAFPFLAGYLRHKAAAEPWAVLGLHVAFCAAVAVAARQLYSRSGGATTPKAR
eukprot:tig00000093_g3633.t1